MIRIEFIFPRFKSIPLGASGERFRKQTKGEKYLFTLRGLVSCDANKTSSELPLDGPGQPKTGTGRGTKWDRAEKDVLKQKKDALKQKRMF